MSTTPRKEFVFTGWHMLGVMLLFFGIVISVNLYMAWQATRSWSGLVVENTYIASQEFNGKVAEAKALAASGITGSLDISGPDIRYELSQPGQGPIMADTVTLKFKRPVGEAHDFDVLMEPAGEGVFTARHDVPDGTWIIEVDARHEGTRILHHTRRIAMVGGVPVAGETQ